jgi:phosphoglycolate phosphatase-like HAD superfamily hydrolase
LALDFDGVVVDALTECAAVTWFAGPGARAPTPGLPEAVASVPANYLATFAQVRSYSRTLDDFMVTNALHPRVAPVSRAIFEEALAQGDPGERARAAAAAEEIRGRWRGQQFRQWALLHTVRPELADLLRTTTHSVVVVSAKDAASIRAILTHHGLGTVDRIIGSCRDKPAALARLLGTNPKARSEGVVFIDDSVANVIAVGELDVESRWALWGYHGLEDFRLAARAGVRQLHIRQLGSLAATTRSTPDRWTDPYRPLSA